MELKDKLKVVNEKLASLILKFTEADRVYIPGNPTAHWFKVIRVETLNEKIQGLIKHSKCDITLGALLDDGITLIDNYDPPWSVEEEKENKEKTKYFEKTMALYKVLIEKMNVLDEKTRLEHEETIKDFIFMANTFSCRYQLKEAEKALMNYTKIIHKKIGSENAIPY